MIDTRRKIVAIDAIRVDSSRAVVAGYFDPLVAAHAERLRELAALHGRLIVCVCDLDDALLPVAARAQLIAACRDVDEVIVADPSELKGFTVLDERDRDLRRRESLMNHVRARQNGSIHE